MKFMVRSILVLWSVMAITTACNSQEAPAFISWMNEPNKPTSAQKVTKANKQRISHILERMVGINIAQSEPYKAEMRTFLDSIAKVSKARLEWQDFTVTANNGIATIGKNGIYKLNTGKNLPIWILGAHYDVEKGSPGADDNVSGMAAMLELLLSFSATELQKEIHFVAFDLEELGLFGSQKYFNSLSSAEKSRIKAMINMDMIGYVSDQPNSQQVPPGFGSVFPNVVKAINEQDNRGNFAIAVANTPAKALLKSISKKQDDYSPELRTAYLILPNAGRNVPTFRRSDHVHFWDAQIPAIFLGDGADTRNPHYNTTMDNLEDLNQDHIQSIATWILNVITYSE